MSMKNGRKTEKLNNSAEMRELGLKIAYYRKLRGLTQEALADKIGMSLNHLSSVEAPNVNRGISLNAVFSIAKVLEIKPSMLFEFSDLGPSVKSDRKEEW